MGLIREPKNVDFYVLDKPWTAEERKEFSAFIKLQKDQQKNGVHLQRQKKEKRLLLDFF